MSDELETTNGTVWGTSDPIKEKSKINAAIESVNKANDAFDVMNATCLLIVKEGKVGTVDPELPVNRCKNGFYEFDFINQAEYWKEEKFVPQAFVRGIFATLEKLPGNPLGRLYDACKGKQKEKAEFLEAVSTQKYLIDMTYHIARNVCDYIYVYAFIFTHEEPTSLHEYIFTDFLDMQRGLLNWHRKSTRQNLPKTTHLSPVIKFRSDNINRAAIQSFSTPKEWQRDPITGIAYGLTHGYKDLNITVGLPESEASTTIWEFLCKSGSDTVKAHYALWARWYEEGGNASSYITLSINQFCEDIGYKKHHNGSFRVEHKQQALRLLETLTRVEIRAEYQPPKKGAKSQRIRGELWRRGLIHEESDGYADLFGSARTGNPNLWEPIQFSYGVGPWFSVPEWAEYNRAVGKISVGLLKLRTDTDEWAILIGGYLATLIRTVRYQPKNLRVGTILKCTGLAQSNDAKRRVTQYRDKFYAALKKLKEAEVIRDYRTAGFDDSDVDLDDPEMLADYGQSNPYPKGDWRAYIVEISFHFEEDRVRLAEQIQGSRKTTESNITNKK